MQIDIGDATGLLGREPSANLIRSIAEVSLRLNYPRINCSQYLTAIESALLREPPPFGVKEYQRVYESLASDPKWMAVSLITNAEREGDGSKRLWSLSACSIDDRHRQLLKRHACDESRHALIYLALLDLAFPGAVSREFRVELRQLSPHFSMQQDPAPLPDSPYAKSATIDDFLQMNIAEIRTAIHHIMQRPELEKHCPPKNLEKLTKLHDALLGDELRHIAYTAVLIDELGKDADPERLTALFEKRFRDFNAITTEELGGNVFDCSVACCAKRPHCRAKAPEFNPGVVLHQIGLSSSASRGS